MSRFLRFDRRLRVAAAALLAFCLVSGADAASLSLFEAVRAAEAQSPELDARRAALAAATDAVLPASQQPDPQLVAGFENLPLDGVDAYRIGRDNMTMRKVGLMQTFVRAEKRRQRGLRAQAEAAREEATLAASRLAVREATARAWIACATAERRLDLLHELGPRADAAVAVAAAALAAGRAAAADGLAAQAAVAMLQDRLSDAERERADARAELARWLPEAAERELGEAPDFGELGRAPEAFLAHADRHREMLTYAAAEAEAQAELALARQETRPDWSLELAYARRGAGFADMLSLQVRVDLPLFAARRQAPAIAARRARLDQVQAERADALRQHTASLRKTLAAWRSARDRAQRYERELLPLAQARADAALAAYRGGRGDLAGTLAAFDAAVEQRLAYSDVLNAVGQSWASLYFAFAQED